MDRDIGRSSYGLSAVCAKPLKRIKKNIENPLTNRPSCDTIRVQKREVASEFGADRPVFAWTMGPLSLWVALSFDEVLVKYLLGKI